MAGERIRQYVDDHDIGKRGFQLLFGVLGATVGAHFVDGMSPDFISSEKPREAADFYEDCSEIYTDLVTKNVPEPVTPGQVLNFTFDIEDVPEKCSNEEAIAKLNDLVEGISMNVVAGSATVTDAQDIRIDRIKRLMDVEMANPELMADKVNDLESSARNRRYATTFGGVLLGGLLGVAAGTGVSRLTNPTREEELV
jgi:hypothetical protein